MFVSSDEASRLEAEISRARHAARQNGLGVKQHLQAVEIAYVLRNGFRYLGMTDAVCVPWSGTANRLKKLQNSGMKQPVLF